MRVGFSSSEVYSSEDEVSEFEMVGDKSCPYGDKLGLLLWFNSMKLRSVNSDLRC